MAMPRLKSLPSNFQSLEIPLTQSSLLTFPLFPRLAPELRNMIWAQSASDPRTIKLFRLDGVPDPAKTSEVDGQQRHLGIIYACRESRKVALKIYEKCEEKLRGRFMRGSKRGNGNTVFVNFSADTFLLVVPSSTPLLPDSAMSTIFTDKPFSDFNFKQRIVQHIQSLEIEVLPTVKYCRLQVTRLCYTAMIRDIARPASICFAFMDHLSTTSTIPILDAEYRLDLSQRSEDLVHSVAEYGRRFKCPTITFRWQSTVDDPRGAAFIAAYRQALLGFHRYG